MTKLKAAFQQKQLLNLLDTVPDQVLICSQKTEEHALIPRFSNREMREFLGGDPVDKKDERGTKAATRKQRISQ